MEKGRRNTKLKVGDTVMIISGGNKNKRPNKGKTGKILRFAGLDKVVVEGLNMITKHEKPAGPEKPGGRIEKEGPLHISNVMYFAEKAGEPVRLSYSFLEDGTKVRGYNNPKDGKFIQVD
ncbi:MAG: 50S ribosomal protein L24 [Deltaproteobacteria bacterium]|nr:50S ribosomal protein L24 [Deltaproteobacteria bacterium]